MVGFPSLSGGSLGSLIVRIDADMRGLNKGLSTSEKRVKQASVRMQAMTKNIDATIRTFNILGTVAVIVGGLLVKSASDFESAFAGVRKTVDATEEEFFQLSEGIINMSKQIPVATTELARIQELAGQLGVSGVENLTKFTEVIAKIAVTTNLTSESAATDFARIANIIRLPLDQIDRLGATVVELGNNFATTEAEIVSFTLRIAGAGKVVGLTAADLTGIATAFSSVGVRAERGGTAVSKALIKIGTAIETGNEDLELFASISGQTIKQFSEGFRNDAAKAFAVFIEGLGKAGLKGAAILKDLELGDQRLVQAFLSVGGATGILTEAVNTANVAFKENTALTEEANKRFSTTASKVLVTRNRINALAISLGEKLLPAFQNILISANALVGVFDKLFGERQAPETLKARLIERIELIDQEIEKQREVIQTALGNATARAEADERINELLIQRSRTLLTIREIEKQANEEREQEQEKRKADLETKAIVEVVTEEKKNASILEKFRAFQKQVKALSDLELKEFLSNAKTKEITAKTLQKKMTETLKEELDKREDAKKKEADIEKELLQQVGDTFDRILRAQAEESKVASFLLQARAIGRAIINTHEGVTKALASANLPLAVVIGALGAVEVATIAGVKFQQGSDNVPFRGITDPGEIVIPKTFAQAIRDGRLTLGGPAFAGEGGRGDTNITNNFTFEQIQLGDDIELDDFTERLGEDVANKSRSVS